MRTVFADAFFWIALIDPKDSWHIRVAQTFADVQPDKLVTTDEVLAETLTFFSKAGSYSRNQTANFIRGVLANPGISVEPQTHQSFLSALRLYEQRLDKGYSIADCASMNTMRQLNIVEVLTHDRHFEQEGFKPLFKL